MHKKSSWHRIFFHSVRKLLSMWTRVEVKNTEAEQLGLPSDKPVLYVLRHRSVSDLMVVESQCRKARLPRPYATCKQSLSDSSFFYLAQHRGMILQHEALEEANTLRGFIDHITEYDSNDILLVPVSVFWGRSPDKEQSVFKLLFDWNFSLGGKFRKFLAILLHGRQVLVQFSPAMSLKDVVSEGQERNRIERKVNRILRVHFRQVRESVIGPDLSHRRMLVNGLIYTPQLRQAIASEAAVRNITEAEAEQKARHYANEIVSDYSYSAVRFLDIVLTWFCNKLYDGIYISNIKTIIDISQTHSIVYVPSHRSHMDYLLLSYSLYYEGMPPPHIAAGVNLNMPVVGSILRKGGAFFMRRTFRGNPLYSAVFHEYLYSLSSRGFPIEYFIEGGRSRTGRTLHPKSGMISLSLRSFFRDSRRPVAFVPVYIGYEKVLEVRTYMSELKGKSKKKESPLDIFRTLSELKNQFGKVWLNFGEPIHLGDFLKGKVPDWQEHNLTEGSKPDWLRSVTNELTLRIGSAINSAAIINPVNLVAMALLSAPRHALGEQELVLVLDTYRRLLTSEPYSARTVITDMDGQSMVKYVEKLDMLSKITDSLGIVYNLSNDNAIIMTYYRNNVLHLFSVPSLLSCLFVNNYKLSFKEMLRICISLYPYLKSELLLKWSDRQFLKVVKQWLHVLTNEGLIVKEGSDYRTPEYSSSEYVMLTVLSRAISQTLERFYMVITLLISNGSDTIEQQTLEKQSRDLAQRLSIIHGLNAPEFFDPVLFKNFIEQLRLNGIIDISLTNKLLFGQDVVEVAGESCKVLTSEVRHSILQATTNQSVPSLEPCYSTLKFSLDH